MTELIKELREMTGAGMLDCQKALKASDSNLSAAVDYLRENGLAKAAKKAGRIAAEGLASVVVKDNVAVIYEVNAETDFVAKNEEFKGLVEIIGNVLVENNNVKTVEEALELNYNGDTINNLIVSKIAKIGENINLRRFSIFSKEDNQVFGSYSHLGGRIVALTLLTGGTENVAKDISMHAAAMNPLYLNKESVPTADAEREKEILIEQTLSEGKPKEIAEKMVIGRMAKFYKESCLIEQNFIKNPDQTVEAFATSNDATIVSMTRYGVGDGIEKEESDFAAEVKKQMEA